MLLNKKHLIVLLIISLIGLSAHAFQLSDTGNIAIHISANPPFISTPPYWVDIYKTNQTIKIVYTIQVFFRIDRLTDKDSLLLDRKKLGSYDSLLNRVNEASVTELENTEANKARNLLDGVYFNFTIVSAMSQSKSAFAHSPDQSSHPLLYELLTKTFAIYRNIKPTAAWNQPKTYGY